MSVLKLTKKCGLTALILACSPVASAQNSTLAKVAAQRDEAAREAYQLLEKGDEAYREQKYGEAVESYAQAVANLPAEAKAVAGLRVTAVQRFSQATLVEAQRLKRLGSYKKVESLLSALEAVDPKNLKLKEFRAKLDDPIRTNPALTAEHTAKVDKVRRLLYEAEGYYDLGLYDRAEMTFEDILRLDKYNKAARRGMERVQASKSDYYGAAHDEARSKLLADVAAQWEKKDHLELKVDQVGGISEVGRNGAGKAYALEKLNTIMIPEVSLRGATISEAIDFLTAVSAEYDNTTNDENEKGISFLIQLGDEEHPAVQRVREARIDLPLRNVPLVEVLRQITQASGTQYRVDDFAIVINAAGFSDPTLVRREFQVGANFLNSNNVTAPEGDDNPFGAAGGDGGRLIAKSLTAAEKLKTFGVSFPDGSSASFSNSTNTLIVRNTAANLDLVEAIVKNFAQTEPMSVVVTTTIVEVSQKNLEQLGFDTVLGELDLSKQLLLSGGTVGTGTPLTDMIGGRPVTSGLRTGELDNSTDGLDALLARVSPPTAAGSSTTGPTGVTTGSVSLPASDNGSSLNSSGIISLRGIINNTGFEMLMRGLSQKTGADIMVRPEVLTQSGVNAVVKVTKEFPYPQEYEPPEIPNSVGGSDAIVTPATPTDFTFEDVGVILEVLPTVGPDRQIIEVAVKPIIRDFEGFINYGTPIVGSSSQTSINFADLTVTSSSAFGEITPNAILKPLFRTIRGNTSLRIKDGYTIVMGGMLQETRKAVNDKVPVLGDLPFFGRLFRHDGVSVEKRSVLIFVTVDLQDAGGKLFRERN